MLFYELQFNIPYVCIGGFRGAHPARAPPKGPNSFVLTYKFYET